MFSGSRGNVTGGSREIAPTMWVNTKQGLVVTQLGPNSALFLSLDSMNQM